MSMKQKAGGLLAAGGHGAIPILSAINAASGAFPPLKSAAGIALFIFEEVNKFKENKEQWEKFGKHIVDTMAGVVAAIDSYDASGEEAKPWMDSITNMSEALKRIQTEIEQLRGKRERRSAVVNFFFHMKDPGKIDDLRRDFNEALTTFQVKTNLTIGVMANVTREVESSSVLSQLRYPIVAHHDSTEVCLPGTRTDLLNCIMGWCRNTEASEKRVMLLTAVAGAGKTSISHSIAEECAGEGILLSTFFFKAGEQSRPDNMFSGMARSLAAHYPAYRSLITSILQKDPTLTTAPFTMQFKKLIAQPLHLRPLSSNRPLVVVIDALDECDKEAFPRLADILRKEVPKLPSNIKFFVTSRQFDLVDRFLSLEFPIDRLGISLSDDANIRDCAIYIRTQLRELKDVHPSLKPKLKEEDEMVQSILERAGGLFIWVSTVFRYMKMASGAPMRMLEKLLDTGTNRSKASAEEMMDALYTSILEKCNWKDEDFIHDFPIVIGTILIAQQPLSIAAWTAILSLQLESSVEHTLAELAPLLSGVQDPHTPIRILHHSFRDFLMDRVNAQSHTLHHFVVDARRENARMAMRCIEILNEDLPSVEALGLVKYLREKEELPPIPQAMLSEQLHYGCRHIVYHLNQVPDALELLNVAVRIFLGQQVTRWVEVCVRTEGYISISSFPEWAKLSVDMGSKEEIHKLRNLEFFSRFQEGHELASDSVALCQTYAPDLATSLGDLQSSLDKLGWDSRQLPAVEESVKLWRELVILDPISHTPDLARSLESLRLSLCRVGRKPEALRAAEESVKICRQLVAVYPTSHNLDLARSLHGFACSLRNISLYSEALTSIEEGVKLLRQLVAIDPTSYSFDLASSLRIFGWVLSSTERYYEAIPVCEESVKLYRQLVAVYPTSFIIHEDLVAVLGYYRNALIQFGQPSEALLVQYESVELCRQLIAVHPTSYTPVLALSLYNASRSFSSIGQHSDALLAIEESVNIWRQLIAVDPTMYYSHSMAISVQQLNISLSNLGRHAAALVAITESVEFDRQLVVAEGILHSAPLSRSLCHLNVTLRNLGQYSEALLAIEESVKLCRHGVDIELKPTDLYISQLIASLKCLNESLDTLGRHSESLLAIEECVKLSRQLVAFRPTTYTTNLAGSLNALNETLNRLERHSEALPVVEESVHLWRQLVAILPASHPSLSSTFYNLGRPAEGLPLIEESISLWRSLSVTHPTSYAPDLALALQTLSTQFSSLGRYVDALDTGNESLSYYRQLHSEYPVPYASQLQLTYSCVANALEGLGRHEELVTVRAHAKSVTMRITDFEETKRRPWRQSRNANKPANQTPSPTHWRAKYLLLL
ncbi:uncharacterized protein EI90DRAFT_3049978 [Cantharellus anzutake]|uniref:uncharacterized protein n=1 Tax=Cantharellus anzutake TaxID=1750568 RepID=UPI001905E611|nr:uncharacterized protein EI90DRAFT_3049978 [Cantharellus anzutake]KAF8334724.1 hypothetical protein EI90DRAFT_3049978 [Cantharellus anzutake]